MYHQSTPEMVTTDAVTTISGNAGAVSRNSPNPSNYGNSGSLWVRGGGADTEEEKKEYAVGIYVIFTLINTIMLTLIVTATGTPTAARFGQTMETDGAMRDGLDSQRTILRADLKLTMER